MTLFKKECKIKLLQVFHLIKHHQIQNQSSIKATWENDHDSFKTMEQRIGLDSNDSKIKITRVNRRNGCNRPRNIGGMNLEEVDQFKYLSSTLTATNNIFVEVLHRI